MRRVGKAGGNALSRALFAVAALCLALLPVLDSAAKAHPADGSASPAQQILRAFDVIDDVLDHLPGQPPGQPQFQLQLPHSLPSPISLPVSRAATAQRWPVETQAPVASFITEGQTRPPRT